MIKRRFLFNKLVRDKALDPMIDQGVIATTKNLSDNDMFLEAITQKVIEELEGVFSCESQEELVEGLADFEEILIEFKKLIGITEAELKAARVKKNQEKGSFSKRIFCDYIDVPESATEIIEYCEENSDTYPELDPKTNEFLDSENHEFEDSEEDEEGDE